MEQRICAKCDVAKNLDDYAKNKREKLGRAYTCKECVSLCKQNGVYKPDKRTFKHTVSKAEYDAVLAKQGGLCYCCGSSKRLCLDHDHSTGKVRGILCSACNLGLGFFRDNPEYMAKAIEYVKNAS